MDQSYSLGLPREKGSRSIGGVIKGNARYGMTMKASSLEYMQWLKNNVFHLYAPSAFVPYPNLSLPQHAGKIVEQYHFSTSSVPFFTALHALWYKWDPVLLKFVKILLSSAENSFWNSIIVYSWITFTLNYSVLTPPTVGRTKGDGYFDSNGRTQTVLLCTESFTKEECALLQKVLLSYSINSSLKVRNVIKNTYRIRISKKSMVQLIDLIGPNMPVSFKYKLGIT